jgi:hypothetical protein
VTSKDPHDKKGRHPFKTCGSCRKSWEQWQDFVLDPGVRILGFQAIENLPDANLLVFEHKCGSSISLLAKRLRHVLDDQGEREHLPVLFGSEVCREHCRLIEDLEACDRPCANSRDRRLIQLLLKMRRTRTHKTRHTPAN